MVRGLRFDDLGTVIGWRDVQALVRGLFAEPRSHLRMAADGKKFAVTEAEQYMVAASVASINSKLDRDAKPLSLPPRIFPPVEDETPVATDEDLAIAQAMLAM